MREALTEAASFEGEASLWGDELYFDVPVRHSRREKSVGSEPRPAGPVAPVGHPEDAERLASVDMGETVRFG